MPRERRQRQRVRPRPRPGLRRIVRRDTAGARRAVRPVEPSARRAGLALARSSRPTRLRVRRRVHAEQETTPRGDVAPQGCIEVRRIAPRPSAVRPANVLVMHEEFVEVGKSPDPSDAEVAARRSRSDLIDERREVALGQLRGTRLGEPMPSPGKDEPRCREVVVLTQHEVGRDISSGPRFEQGRRVGTECDEELAQLLTLDCVECAVEVEVMSTSTRGRR